MPPVIAFLAVLIASPQGPSAGADERLAWFAVIPPDGWTFATASSDRTVRLWHTATGTERAIFQGHTRDVVSVSFAADGRTVASTGIDGTLRLWNVPDR